MRLQVVLWTAALAGWGAPQSVAWGEAWLTGPRLAQQMASPVTATWSGAPLRPALLRLAETQRVAVFIDRRVDPGQKLTLAVNQQPLQTVWAQVAADRHLGHCVLGGAVVYFGPPESAARLRTVAALAGQAVDALPPPQRSALRRKQPWQWEDLATPRELLDELMQQSGLTLSGEQLVPHDLWPQADLPPLSLVDRLSLVLAGFELTFTVAADGRSIVLAPVEPPVQLERRYPFSDPRVVGRLRELFPKADIKAEQQQMLVSGRAEDHEQIEALLKGQSIKRPVPGPKTGTTVYTLKIQNQPIGRMMEQLARQVNLEIEWAEREIADAGISLETLVSFSVENATLDALLNAALEPAGLTFELKGAQLRIGPGK